MPGIQSRSAKSSRLVGRTAVASMEVAATRLSALADPLAFGGHRQQREIDRMVAEKMNAGIAGASAACSEAWMLPWRMAYAFARPDLLTARGTQRIVETWWAAWCAMGDAALRPAATTVARNRVRLRTLTRR